MSRNYMLTCTTKDLAQIYGCSVQYIGELIKRGDLPKPIKQNCHDVIKAAAAIVEIVKREASEAQSNIDAEKHRLVRARARLAEIEVLEAQKILVPAKAVEEAAFGKARTLRDSLMNIPSRVAPIIAAERDADKCFKILDVEIRQSLEAIAGDLKETLQNN